MAINKGTYQRAWVTTRPSVRPANIIDVAETLVAAKIVNNISVEQINLGGSVQISGSIAETKADLAASGITDEEFLSGSFDLRGKDNVPRVVVSVIFSTRQVTLTINSGDGALHQTILALVQRKIPPAPEVEIPVLQSSGPPDPRQLRSGLVIDAYKLVNRLGSGQSGEVWTAEVLRVPQGIHLKSGDLVAMKHYSRGFLSSAELIRVQREFLVATELDHPHLVKVHDLVLSPSRPFHSFLVMDFLKGRTLKDSIPRAGLPRDRIVSIATDIFSALEALHSRRALHRDVKAANILLMEDSGSGRLLDLGIVALAGDPSLTGTSVFIGSKHSAPLEQLMGEELDHRTDIYAMGTVMYHCYMGHPIYHRAGPEGAIVAQMLRSPMRLVARSSDARDQKLVAFINECIEIEAAARPSSAAACIQRLREI